MAVFPAHRLETLFGNLPEDPILTQTVKIETKTYYFSHITTRLLLSSPFSFRTPEIPKHLEDSLPVQNRQILLRFLLLPSPKNLHFFVFRKIESRLRLLRSAVAPRENPVPGKRRTAFSSSQRKRKKQRPETDTDFSPFFCCCFFPS